MNQPLKILLLIDFSEEYGRALLRGITRYSQLHGPWSFCKMPPFVREKYGMAGILKFAKEWEAQGIIAQMDNNKNTQPLLKTDICIIAQDFRERFKEIPNITGDYFKTGLLAADYFLSKGFQNFAFYGFKNFVWSRERAEGFMQRIRENGFETETFNNEEKDNQLWYYSQSPLSEWLLQLPKPVALFACDDNQAIHIAEACNIAGIRIPDEVAILGVDNDEMVCNMSNPPISSIALDTENAGFRVAHLMENMILHPHLPKENILVEPIGVITRQSTDIFAINDREVIKALHFIRDNLVKKIQVNDVVKKVALSRRSLEIRFAKTLGRSVYQEILNQKMRKATQLLIQSRYSILEIAVLLGYEDDKNFARIFHKYHQNTPLQYRIKFSRMK